MRASIVLAGFTRYYTCSRRDAIDNKSAKIWLERILYGHYKLFAVLSIPIVAFAARVLRRSLPPSDPSRRRVLKLNFGCVLAFSVEWICRFMILMVGLFQWNDAVDHLKRNENTNTSALTALSFTYASLESLRSFWDSIVWFVTNGLTAAEIKSHVKRIVQRLRGERRTKDELFMPLLPQSISSALRHDMIRCSSWGIIDSAPVGARNIRESQLLADNDGGISLATLNRSLGRKGVFLSEMAKRERTRRRIHCPSALHCKHFDFCDYSPDVFDRLRALRGTSPITYCKSFGISETESDAALVEKFTEGRSGSFFYFTQDNRYIVKTVTPSEANFLQANISDYYAHLHRNPNSLLTRFFGLHATRLSIEQQSITLAVMENLFPADRSLRISERYDLKGSWVNRQTLKGKDRLKPRSSVTLKDCDLEEKFLVGEQTKEKLLQQLRRDVKFLVRLGVMDYR